jgi:uncharacterized protein
MEYKAGEIVWTDLTIDNATDVKEFYERVVGWKSSPLSMGTYDDYLIKTGDEKVVAGICHARGSNANLPAQWLVYVAVEDVTASAAACEALGGKLLDGPRKMNGKDFCVIQDPAGAVMALIGT